MSGWATHFWGAARRAGFNSRLSSLSDLLQLDDLKRGSVSRGLSLARAFDYANKTANSIHHTQDCVMCYILQESMRVIDDKPQFEWPKLPRSVSSE
jgi:hypothetical protein